LFDVIGGRDLVDFRDRWFIDYQDAGAATQVFQAFGRAEDPQPYEVLQPYSATPVWSG